MSDEVRTPPGPDVADRAYGPHPRHAFDFWRVPNAAAAPLLIWVHGGGFLQGDKAKVHKDLLVERFVADGIAVASINYRLTDSAPYPAQMHDAARALQYLRYHACEFGIDSQRIACAGQSAGSGISQWLGYHADLADPRAEDPVARQSTRICAVGAFNMQCTYDPRLIKEIVPGKAYDHKAMKRLFGVGDAFDWDRDPIPPEAEERMRACGPLSLLGPDAPPVFICNRIANLEVGNIHHAKFGEHLAERLAALGVRHWRRMDSDYEDRQYGPAEEFRGILLDIFRAQARDASPSESAAASATPDASVPGAR